MSDSLFQMKFKYQLGDHSQKLSRICWWANQCSTNQDRRNVITTTFLTHTLTLPKTLGSRFGAACEALLSRWRRGIGGKWGSRMLADCCWISHRQWRNVSH